jgi:hypothetical protein
VQGGERKTWKKDTKPKRGLTSSHNCPTFKEDSLKKVKVREGANSLWLSTKLGYDPSMMAIYPFA